MHRSESRPAGIVALTMSVFLVALATLLTAHPVAAEIYTVTSTECEGMGSISEAMSKANDNPGEDTISFRENLQIKVDDCPTKSISNRDYFILQATESVTFEGNGARLVGKLQWIDTSGDITPLNDCPEAPTILVTSTPGFIKVGRPNQDNSAISVTVRGLDLFELNSVARIEKNASLVLEDASLDRIISHVISCRTPAILGKEGANFSALRTSWNTILNFSEPSGPGLFEGAISNDTFDPVGGDLIIEDSDFFRVGQGNAIYWSGKPGSAVNVVSSIFDDAGGAIVAGEATTEIVNTIWAPATSFSQLDAGDQFINVSTEPMEIRASTLLLPQLTCDFTCRQNDSLGWIYRNPGAGEINFIQSAVGVNFFNEPPGGDTGKLLDPDDGTGFSADVHTWIQPTTQQDAEALKRATDQKDLLTGSPALRTELFFSSAAVWATPLVPGVLIDVIDDGCVLNPIDGDCIELDPLGNPREDGNEKRDIGAVQLTLAPHLTVAGTDDKSVDLGWSKTQPPESGGPINGYEVCDAEVTGELPDPGTIDECSGPNQVLTSVAGPDELETTITSLTNGTAYWFAVRAVDTVALPWSNVVTATPFGEIDAPEVTAVPGDRQVALSWNLPDLGGREFLDYTILWRVAGTDEYLGTQTIDNPDTTTTTVTGLKNGTTYEFVVGVDASGEASASGSATATPHGDVGTVDRNPDESKRATSEANKPRFWERLGYGECSKFEVADDFGSVWNLEADASALILKSARVNDVWVAPTAGLYGTASAKDISHAIVCFPTL